ncbi:tyrosine-type recombinase/integrase [Rhodococcus oxybenzonivorans]|uniref:tyrosine-type recombinase/integrase n=1 Tax=Rhodococcus oxybenzonivorans TaxID=1990687 RepID=UPI001E35F463|nr:tyrosine-type recombinase/integrase [Rhodococcus oxybenzonivorans]
MAHDRSVPPGSANLHLAHNVPLLHPEELVFQAMLSGWERQQLARNLSLGTIQSRIRVINRFRDFCDGAGPWVWTAVQADDWSAELRSITGSAHNTVLGYEGAIRQFMAYLLDPAYGWADECMNRFDTHPVQIFHEGNTARHVQDANSDPRKRAFTVDELQDLCDVADDQVALKVAAGRKGWTAAFRTATIAKLAYAWGLRRNEVRMLDLTDFGHNPNAKTFGQFGVCYVRYGKASHGSAPKRRSVLTVPEYEWVVDCLRQWIEDIRPMIAEPGNPALFPTERSDRISKVTISSNFSHLCDLADLSDPGLDFHSLRRSYVSHLVEHGYDARFVQEQAGHEHASTTSLYTHVSSDYRTRVVSNALNKMTSQVAKNLKAGGSS